MQKLKRIVIKEELVVLTGCFKQAIVLNQMIYWSERRKDADVFSAEEKERFEKYYMGADRHELKLDSKQSHGWIYKKAEELSEETMIGVKPKAMREYIKALVEKGYLEERRNPDLSLDRTLQYRVNLLNIQIDLQELGYALEGYPLAKVEKENTQKPSNGAKVEKENRKGEKENRKGEKEKAIPEITTEITSNQNQNLVNKDLEKDVNKNQEIIDKLVLQYMKKGLPKDLCFRVIEENKNKKVDNLGGYLRGCLENTLYKYKSKNGTVSSSYSTLLDSIIDKL